MKNILKDFDLTGLLIIVGTFIGVLVALAVVPNFFNYDFGNYTQTVQGLISVCVILITLIPLWYYYNKRQKGRR